MNTPAKNATLPAQAQVVIIGGGIIGCSLAYHLTKLNLTDVVLLERKRLTSGTTWHAAGLVGQLRATRNLTQLAQYTSNLLATLEADTGQPTGFRQNGSVSIANNAERFEELKRGASMARVFGLEVEVISAREAAALWPLMDASDVVGAVWLPKDGRTNPVDTTQAFARGAEQRGARIFENIAVTGICKERGRVTGVRTEQGTLQCEVVVNCAGMWARQVGQWAGVSVPLHAAEHFYIVSEPIAGVHAGLPTLRDPGGYTYYREEVGAILAGFFEPVAKPWGMNGIPANFEFTRLPEDWAHLDPVFDVMARRMPVLGTAGIHTFFNGPESFTPDDAYHLGEAPELQNFYVAAGFNSIGIQSSGGAGKVLAEWIVNGHAPLDLWDVDLRRNQPFQNNARYLQDRTVEGLGLLYDMHWPFKQFKTARNVRRSSLHDRLAAAGACFGSVAGWERPNWYAPAGVEPEYKYSYGRQNWFAYSAAEHRAVRENVGLFDQSSFSKFLMQGRDALAVLNRVCGNQIDVPVGVVVYTQLLNARGGIEADVTVNRLDAERFLILDAAALQNRTGPWLQRQIQTAEFATLTDVTSAYTMLGVMGPQARALLSQVTSADLSNAAFPFATSREIEVGYAMVRATRLTYVGELGWELLAPTEFALGVYEALLEAGRAFDLKLAGFHALNSLRQEKGYRHWGHDIGDEDTPLEAGLGFAVKLNKPAFNGRERLLAQQAAGVTRRLVQFALEDPAPLLYHNEPIWRDGEMVGHITSAMYGHTVGAAVGMGYVRHSEPVTAAFIDAGRYEIEVATQRVPARACLQSFYDPRSLRVTERAG